MLLAQTGRVSGTAKLEHWRARRSGWTPGPSKLLRKEVIQPQVPLRLPCYDFTPITDHTFGACFLAVGSATSGTTGFRGVTGGVYKARERIQRSLLICAY
jgi:hypothetical protein